MKEVGRKSYERDNYVTLHLVGLPNLLKATGTTRIPNNYIIPQQCQFPLTGMGKRATNRSLVMLTEYWYITTRDSH